MYHVKCKRNFGYCDYDKCTDIIRVKQDTQGSFFTGDRFSCTKDMYLYLNKGNSKKLSLVELIGIDKKM